MLLLSRRDMRKRVKRGASLLTEEYGPEWVEKIDTKTLDIARGDLCVLGQVYGDYGIGMDKLNLLSGHRYGFSDELIEYPRLNKEWKRLITASKKQLARSA